MGNATEFRFDPGPLGLADVQRLAADMWSDIAFDEQALSRLRRDGLMLDGVRLTGPCPFQIDQPEGQDIRIRVEHGAPAEILLDLWQLHFSKGLRPGSLAA